MPRYDRTNPPAHAKAPHAMTSKRPVLIVGAGFSGAVIARQLAEHLDLRVLVIDERNHVAGNCHTEREDTTGIMVHRYGPHIFHTDREDVWRYVNRFAEFGQFTNRVKAVTAKGVYSLPINLMTINQFFGKRFTPAEARAFVESLGDQSIRDPQTFEEQALRFLGADLYMAFFHGYTKKQWGCEPSELPASILKRLPVRFNYDDRYYSSRYQGIPLEGYTAMIERILDHPNIEVKLGIKFERSAKKEFSQIFYTGPIDAYFDHEYGRLGYRTVSWEREEGSGDYQGNAVINYTDESVPYTRVHEHKHFAPWEAHEKTVVFTEFSKEADPRDIPYYPKRLSTDMGRLSKYLSAAEEEEDAYFVGRLATYRYLDMDTVIAEALDFSAKYITSIGEKVPMSSSTSIPMP